MVSHAAGQDTTQEQLAALLVRTKCNQHDCVLEGCTDENHRRDVDYLNHCLAMLGLPGAYQPVSDEQRAEWSARAVQSAREAS